MKALAFFLILVGVCVLALLVLAKVSGPKPEDFSLTWLGVAALLVAVATLSQVVFAVITYLEGVTLRHQIEEVQGKLDRHREQNLKQIQGYKDAFYHTARASVAALMEVFTYSDPSPHRENALKGLRIAQMNADLAHGTYPSLWSAMQTAFQLDKKRFMDLECEIWECSSLLAREESDRIRGEYKKLKQNILKRRL